jgi:hypothetical protein
MVCMGKVLGWVVWKRNQRKIKTPVINQSFACEVHIIYDLLTFISVSHFLH